MLKPKKTKFNKFRKGRIKATVSKNCSNKYSASKSSLQFGSIGLRAIEGGRIKAKQLEAARRVIRRKLNRSGRLFICVFPDTPVTGKPTEVRMGKGKGAVSYWCARVKPGQIIFELNDIPAILAKQVLLSASKKFSLKSNILERPKPILF